MKLYANLNESGRQISLLLVLIKILILVNGDCYRMMEISDAQMSENFELENSERKLNAAKEIHWDKIVFDYARSED